MVCPRDEALLAASQLPHGPAFRRFEVGRESSQRDMFTALCLALSATEERQCSQPQNAEPKTKVSELSIPADLSGRPWPLSPPPRMLYLLAILKRGLSECEKRQSLSAPVTFK